MDRREMIIHAALQLYHEKGVAFTRAKDIAKLARVPAPLINYYFPNTEDLHEAIMDAIEQGLRSASVTQVQNPIELIMLYAAGNIAFVYLEPRAFSFYFYAYSLASVPGRFQNRVMEKRQEGYDRLKMWIYQGIEKNLLKIDPERSVDTLAKDIHAVIVGRMFQLGTVNVKPDLKMMQRDLIQCIAKLLNCSDSENISLV